MTAQVELPRLRPLAFGGEAYYGELKQILEEIGPQLRADAEAIKAAGGAITVADLCRLALKYTLNVKATCEALEDWRILACGTYDMLRDRGFKPMQALREVAALDRKETRGE